MFDIPRSTGRRGSRHDQVFKDLIGGFLPDFLTLVAPEPAGRLDLSHWKLLDKETFTDWPRGRRRELDLLAEVPLAAAGGRTALIHVEIHRFLLANCVETYLQCEGRDAEELAALQARDNAKEVRAMRLTWADQLRKEGQEQGGRQILLDLLGARFGPLSEEVKQRVEGIHSVKRLTEIAKQVLVAHSLEEMGLR